MNEQALAQTPSYWVAGGFRGGVYLYGHTKKDALDSWTDSVKMLGMTGLLWLGRIPGTKTEAQARAWAEKKGSVVIATVRIERFWEAQMAAIRGKGAHV